MKKDNLYLVASRSDDYMQPVELKRAKVSGWVKFVFWGLRVYIVAMVVLVAIGFARGQV
ncbi:MAG: hypothetical protein OWR52_12870 [Acidibacillus sp.]|uniref:Uncharacterized protein n=1 Tax=Sulfoacidibacillus ferrooxidans TaxID=2005001 RepID=A0A9X1V6Y1_9BACL|nr:hypothetical protein [Sulfoacidibacillus ferrooxidans]MCI0182149.1 hypothetical protein [Sulfoacidibacillus ferrooxidans]MCY0894376.1 hypothetical protein [Acidibacillus sp.]